jgi:hypothetical protein
MSFLVESINFSERIAAMLQKGGLPKKGRWVIGCLTTIFLSVSILTVRVANADQSHAGTANPANSSFLPSTLIMHQGVEVSITTKAGETIPGRYDHKTADDLYVIASSDRIARRIAHDSIAQVSVYGTGSMDRSLLLGAVGFAFGYAIGNMIDASGGADSSTDRRIILGIVSAGLGILSGATTRAQRARLSADAFWELPDTRRGNTLSQSGMRLELAIRF